MLSGACGGPQTSTEPSPRRAICVKRICHSNCAPACALSRADEEEPLVVCGAPGADTCGFSARGGSGRAPDNLRLRPFLGGTRPSARRQRDDVDVEGQASRGPGGLSGGEKGGSLASGSPRPLPGSPPLREPGAQHFGTVFLFWDPADILGGMRGGHSNTSWSPGKAHKIFFLKPLSLPLASAAKG